MDWRSVRFNWNQARAFLVTAEEGSLSAAARALDMTQPTLGRQVEALQEELGVLLFERVGRGLVLTESGRQLLGHVQEMGDAAGRMSLAASGQSQTLEGSVCISASETISAFVLPPIIAKLRSMQPGIDIELMASNAASDLNRREADIAIRNFRPTQDGLIAKKVADERVRLYATADYIRSIGTPRTPASLSRAAFIGFDSSDGLMNALNALGLSLTPKNFPLTSTSHLAGWALAKQGIGISLMMEAVGEPDPEVVQVLPTFAPIVIPLWLTAHRELHTSRRVRVVFDLLEAELAPLGLETPSP